MCGILGVKVKEWDNDIIKNLYEIFLNQKNRGIKGAGISVNGNGKFYRFRSISPFRIFNAYNMNIWNKIENGDSVLVHHRFPTSTDNEVLLNHPLANEDDTIHLIHNGIINNDKELRKQLEAKGHVFEAVDSKGKITDSEVILHCFEDGLIKHKGDVIQAIKYMHDKVSGCMAIALNIKGDDNIYLFRWGNPLVVFKDKKDNIYFSSVLDEKEKQYTFIHKFDSGEIGKIGSDGFKVIHTINEEYNTGWANNDTKNKKGKSKNGDLLNGNWRYSGSEWYWTDDELRKAGFY